MADSDEAFMDSGEEEPESEPDTDPDDGIAMETPRGDAPVEQFKFEVLTPEAVVQHMCEIIRDVKNIIQIPHTICRILLHQYKWDKEKLFECYYDSNNPETFFQKAHVVSPFTRYVSNRDGAGPSTAFSKPRISTMSPGSQMEMCQICCSMVPAKDLTGLECNDKFCCDCWCAYLTNKVMGEGKGHTISCAAHKCDILVDDDTALKLIRDPKVIRRYHQLMTSSFVECNRYLRWCPSPDCGNVIKVAHIDWQPVTCTCGKRFCFLCGYEWHEPINCRLLKLWVKKCTDDSETSNWLNANTKECPKCQVTIEKDGGCNHMTCKSTSCKQEFCWVCLGPWEPHGNAWYACNRFDDSAAKNARDAQERSRAALQRYLHYCNRYMNHQNSLKLEHKLYGTVKNKMEQMQAQHMSWIEVQFLSRAVDTLTQCRRTLMYTYAFAFYVIKNNQSIIFENNQSDLEMATEQLSGALERDLDRDNLVNLKQKVQDKYRYCEARRVALLEHCKEGTEKNWWSYSE